MKLFYYISERMGVMLMTLFLISIVVFSLQMLLPGDPALAMMGEEGDEKFLNEIRHKYHFDEPLYKQYIYWLQGALQGDLGRSVRTNISTTDLIGQKLGVSLELSILSLLIALAIAIPTGIYCAIRKNTVSDMILNVLAFSGLSIPNFWLGIMMIYLFSVKLGWLPSMGYVPLTDDIFMNLKTMIMPAFVLGTSVASVIMRHMRSSVLEIMNMDYVRTAKAKGLSEKNIIIIHVLPNALLPVVNITVLEFGALLSGAVLTEQVFSIPGVGKLMIDSVFTRDFMVIQGVVLTSGALYILLNFTADIIIYFLNPKLRK